ncbi:SDR family oxidoreductase [Dactylosporangium sp. NPDC050588]|uniref:SDR family oxidoreductase n=1 Tax=Dactylosporangium sp. NPDC050588 TaxID=3157211 RepID=UPI0033F047DE
MHIAVIGGTGRIGSRVVDILTSRGHRAVPHALSTGLDLFTGRGVTEGLRGADVVVNVTSSPTFDDRAAAFFRTTMDNLLRAAVSEDVGHAVLLSIVGIDRVPNLAYYRAKVTQEDILKSAPVPYSIVRATQFFEFIDTVMSWTSDEHAVRLPATPIQPIAADDVARAVADVSVGAPLRGTREVAGPDVFSLDALGRLALAAHHDPRPVITDNSAGLFAAVPGDALIPRSGVVIAPTRFQDWSARVPVR